MRLLSAMRIVSAAVLVFAPLCVCAAAGGGAPAGAAAPSEITIPGQGIFPESLSSSADGRVFIGGIGSRSIFMAKAGASAAETWIPADSDAALGVYGVFADEKNGTLWACFSSQKGADDTATESVLRAFDLKTGKLKARYLMPKGAFCNDIAVGADRTAYVSDSGNMEIDRLVPGSDHLEAWATGGAFGPKGGILDGISVLGNRVFVNVLLTDKLFVVPIGADGKAGAVAEVKLDRAINHPDGMRSFGSDSLLMIEGGGAGRLSLVKISGGSGHLTTLHEGYPQGPVAVTAVGKTAYVLEGQLSIHFGPNPGAPTQPFHATAVSLPTQ